jgi:hypothetical protein
MGTPHFESKNYSFGRDSCPIELIARFSKGLPNWSGDLRAMNSDEAKRENSWKRAGFTACFYKLNPPEDSPLLWPQRRWRL